MDSMRLGELAAAGTAVLWTLSAVAWTSAGPRIGALAVSFLRLPITCVFLAVYGGLVRGLWLPTDASAGTWWVLGVSGFVGFFLSDMCLFKAFLLIGTRLSLLIQSIAPPITAILAWLWLDQGLPDLQWLAMTVTIVGVAWVVLERQDDGGEVPTARRRRLGIWLAVLAAIGQAVGLVLSKVGLAGYDPVAATFIRILGAMIGYLVLITVVRRWKAMRTAAAHAKAMAIVLFGSLVGPFLGVALCMVALQYSHPGVTATIISTTPVLILPFAILMYREKVSLRGRGCGPFGGWRRPPGTMRKAAKEGQPDYCASAFHIQPSKGACMVKPKSASRILTWTATLLLLSLALAQHSPAPTTRRRPVSWRCSTARTLPAGRCPKATMVTGRSSTASSTTMPRARPRATRTSGHREFEDFVLRVDWRIKETPYLNPMPYILPDGTHARTPAARPSETLPDSDSGILLRGSGKDQVNIWCWPIGSGEMYGIRTDPNAPPDSVPP